MIINRFTIWMPESNSPILSDIVNIMIMGNYKKILNETDPMMNFKSNESAIVSGQEND